MLIDLDVLNHISGQILNKRLSVAIEKVLSI